MRSTILGIIAGCCLLAGVASCDGIFSGIYDDTSEDSETTAQGQLYINATSWQDWYYIDLDSLQALVADSDSVGLSKAQTTFAPYHIPMEETAGDDSTGIYTYWFDVFDKGLSHNELREFRHTAPQPEPEHWSFAVHRQDVRTNGGAALETTYTSMDQLPETSEEFHDKQFTPDEWSQNEVWADQSRMLTELIDCQGIKINHVLSSWLTVNIPPMPPSFSSNRHVFIVRFPNGKYAALQLQDYVSRSGTQNCWLTINYRYPY